MKSPLNQKMLFRVLALLAFLSMAHTSSFSQGTDEEVIISPFYPSPKGIYDNLEVVTDLILDPGQDGRVGEGVLKIAGGAPTPSGQGLNAPGILMTTPTFPGEKITRIKEDGSLRASGFQFIGDKYYTKTLRAGELVLTDSTGAWKVPTLQIDNAEWLGGWSDPRWGVGFGSSTSFDCNDGGNLGFIGGVQNLSGIMPWCIGIPIPPDFCIAVLLCAGEEQFIMSYKCIRPQY